MAKVTIYSTPGCPWCKKAKQLLEAHSIAYSDVNVATDASARQEMVKKSGQLGVPVTEIDGHIVIGYDEVKLKQLLGLR